MTMIGKNPKQRRRVSVRKSSAPQAKSSSANLSTSSIHAAVYIADICGELMLMAKDAQLVFLAHLLSMAQAEAEYAAELKK